MLIVAFNEHNETWTAGICATGPHSRTVNVPFVHEATTTEINETKRTELIGTTPVEALRAGLERIERNGLFVSTHRYRSHLARSATDSKATVRVVDPGPEQDSAIYNFPISALDLPGNVAVRVTKILELHGLDTIGKVVSRHPGDFQQFKGFGTVCLDCLIDALASYGLKLGDLYEPDPLETALAEGAEEGV